MITRVLDPDGSVVHDCAENGCETSWDGVTIATGKAAAGAKKRKLPPHDVVDRTTVTLHEAITAEGSEKIHG